MEFIECIKKFNRKERYFLVKYAVSGEEDGNRDEGFSLSVNFRNDLEEVLKVPLGGIKIPKNAYATMDYHLDWLYASLMRAFCTEESGPVYSLKSEFLISGTQEDIDFIVAFQDQANGKDVYHLILIEAKGDTSWDNEQMESKCKERFPKIFGADQPWYGQVKPYLVLMSPNPSKRLAHDKWGEWMLKKDGTPYYLKLPFPSEYFFVERCDKIAEKKWQNWEVKEKPKKQTLC